MLSLCVSAQRRSEARKQRRALPASAAGLGAAPHWKEVEDGYQ